jgi:hypothetical protein
MKETVLVPIAELDFSPDYLADVENGRIWSNISQKWLDPKPNKRFGYCYTTLKIDGKSKPYSIHTLIMSAHFGVKKGFWLNQGLEINHISDAPDTKQKNGISNLELKTRKQQYDDTCRAKLGKGKRLKVNEASHILAQWEYWQQDEDNKKSTFCNIMSEEYGCSYSCIEDLINRKTWTKLEVNVSEYDDVDIDSCLVCSGELDLVEYENAPEWAYVCPSGHFKRYIAFWGEVLTINGKDFSIPSGGDSTVELDELDEYLESIEVEKLNRYKHVGVMRKEKIKESSKKVSEQYDKTLEMLSEE